MHQDSARRFGGIARLYGQAGLARLQDAHVCVIGVGGVGSWAVEALARSAVGRLTLIDMDHVALSNINRQLPALDATLGQAKVTVLAERVAGINPGCRVVCVEDFITADNLDALLRDDMDWVLDCIDSYRVKAALIAHCRRRKLRILTMGGAGGQTDPGRIRIGDLSRTEQDPLLAKTRKLLRTDFGFSRNPKRRFDVPAVYSTEALRRPVDVSRCDATSGLNCAGFGAATHVTASFGLFGVGHLLGKLAGGKPGDDNTDQP